MTLAALLDCAPELEPALLAALAGLGVGGYDLTISKVKREGIGATDVNVALTASDSGHGRHLSDIVGILQGSSLAERVVERATAIFERLADAEAKIHGVSCEEIHFHEVGAVDAIVDIVGACILLDLLAVEEVHVSSFPCGYGTIKCQHGIMPCPAPATMELLAGFPVRSVDIEGELVTPTGAAILTTLGSASTAGSMPSMRVMATGYGAGKKQFKADMPNLLRVVIGEVDEPESGDDTPKMVAVLETNIDDQSPEMFELVMTRAFEGGALDVFLSPIQMKKHRAAHILTILCPVDLADRMADLIFRETGTFGMRVREQRRYTLQRSWVPVDTPYGAIRIKVGERHGEQVVASPEYEDCKAAALKHSVALRDVFDAAKAAWMNARR